MIQQVHDNDKKNNRLEGCFVVFATWRTAEQIQKLFQAWVSRQSGPYVPKAPCSGKA